MGLRGRRRVNRCSSACPRAPLPTPSRALRLRRPGSPPGREGAVRAPAAPSLSPARRPVCPVRQKFLAPELARPAWDGGWEGGKAPPGPGSRIPRGGSLQSRETEGARQPRPRAGQNGRGSPSGPARLQGFRAGKLLAWEVKLGFPRGPRKSRCGKGSLCRGLHPFRKSEPFPAAAPRKECGKQEEKLPSLNPILPDAFRRETRLLGVRSAFLSCVFWRGSLGQGTKAGEETPLGGRRALAGSPRRARNVACGFSCLSWWLLVSLEKIQTDPPFPCGRLPSPWVGFLGIALPFAAQGQGVAGNGGQPRSRKRPLQTGQALLAFGPRQEPLWKQHACFCLAECKQVCSCTESASFTRC